jgi:hypothetical protein
MADSTGVQVFVGPANQLELGDVVTGPPAVTLETVSDRLQRLHLSIPAPTQEVIDSAAGAQVAAEAAALDAEAAQTAAAAAAASATTSATSAAGSLTAAQTAQAAAQAAEAALTDEALDAAVLRVITPATLLIDTDGRPYFA